VPELVGALVGALVVGLAGWLMWRSWRRRSRRDAAIGSYPVPTGLGEPSVDAEVLYVATTPAGRPLERLALPGLGFRGAGHVAIHPEGVLLRIAGEQPTFVPAPQLVGAGTASYAIDRGVEPDGLVAITWVPRGPEPAAPEASAAREASAAPEASAVPEASAHPDPTHASTHVDSYLRARYPGDAARIIAAVTELAAAHTPRPDATERGTND
jgi:hypothetical protein